MGRVKNIFEKEKLEQVPTRNGYGLGMVKAGKENPNVVVLQNRSYLSHIAYHAQTIDELPQLLSLADFDPQSDLPFVLHCDVDAAFARVIRRSPEKSGVVYANEQPEYTLRVKRNFEGLGKLIAGLVFIDTSGEIDTISKGIKDKVDQYFRGKT